MIFDSIGGRKVGVTLIGVVFAFICPIVYKLLQIDSSITQVVLGVIGAALGIFGAANVIDNKTTAMAGKEEEK
jgi:putative effector of murein hydrolase